MTFSSITFVFYFLPFVLVLYYLSPDRLRNLVLLFLSLVFYAWGELEYVGILLFSFGINYFFGRWISIAKTRQQSLYIAGLGVFSNLALLGFFKYTRLLIRLDEELGLGLGINQPHLPLGISFFTFQAITYLVDIQRKEISVEKNPINLALYISMFPQIVAGPIIRFKQIAHQLHHRNLTIENFSQGIRWFIIGMAMKVLIADTIGYPAEQISYLRPEELTACIAWVGLFLYSLQIYFDFAGYSNMAIGLGLMLGFNFPVNFNFPYVSQSISEFWKRWHMTLSNFFKNYLYIPLGGNRRGIFRTCFNLTLVFFLCGLWHGAALHYVYWGIYHGVFLVIERIFPLYFSVHFPRLIRHIYVLLVLIVGWLIFWRFDPHTYFKVMMGLGDTAVQAIQLSMYIKVDTLLAIVIGVLASTPLFSFLEDTLITQGFLFKRTKQEWIVRTVSGLGYLALFILSVASLSGHTYRPFLYFNF